MFQTGNLPGPVRGTEIAAARLSREEGIDGGSGRRPKRRVFPKRKVVTTTRRQPREFDWMHWIMDAGGCDKHGPPRKRGQGGVTRREKKKAGVGLAAKVRPLPSPPLPPTHRLHVGHPPPCPWDPFLSFPPSIPSPRARILFSLVCLLYLAWLPAYLLACLPAPSLPPSPARSFIFDTASSGANCNQAIHQSRRLHEQTRATLAGRASRDIPALRP